MSFGCFSSEVRPSALGPAISDFCALREPDNLAVCRTPSFPSDLLWRRPATVRAIDARRGSLAEAEAGNVFKFLVPARLDRIDGFVEAFAEAWSELFSEVWAAETEGESEGETEGCEVSSLATGGISVSESR
jgi:hypothetical protein